VSFDFWAVAALVTLYLSLRCLLPMKAVRLQLGALLAADATTLAPASLANEVALIIAPFALSENLTVASLTLGSTNGLSPINCATGAQEVAQDPVTGSQLITIVPAAGSGFRWVSSGSFTAPITVYGYALLTNAGAVLLGAQALPTPIVFQSAGYQLDIDPLQIGFVLSPMF
jgi:hypothetical protein